MIISKNTFAKNKMIYHVNFLKMKCTSKILVKDQSKTTLSKMNKKYGVWEVVWCNGVGNWWNFAPTKWIYECRALEGNSSMAAYFIEYLNSQQYDITECLVGDQSVTEKIRKMVSSIENLFPQEKIIRPSIGITRFNFDEHIHIQWKAIDHFVGHFFGLSIVNCNNITIVTFTMVADVSSGSRHKKNFYACSDFLNSYEYRKMVSLIETQDCL